MTDKQMSDQNITEWKKLTSARRWVVKIGSALLTDDGKGLARNAIGDWVEQMAALRRAGIELVLVSSGSIAEGMARLKMKQRPHEVHALQAAAAVGQMGLVQAYESEFQRYNMHTAQVLITHEDLSNRQRYLNARSTLRELLRLGVVPVINENDTVVTEEIRFGDNDTLGALVTNLVEAEALIILTDQKGVHERDPRTDCDAPLISVINAHDQRLDQMAGSGKGRLGQGGMQTKIRAARLAARSGSFTVIAGGREPQVLSRLQQGEPLGTLLVPDLEPIDARKRWLAGSLKSRGCLVLDDGAVNVLKKGGKSLLAVGVVDASGSFVRGDRVTCMDSEGEAVALGLVNYSLDEVKRLLGKSSDEIEMILGYVVEPELIHRDNMVVL